MQAGSSWRFCESVFRPLVIDLRTPVEAAPRGEALKMEAVLRELGYRRAVLDAVPPTKNAQLLYEAMGFYEIPPYFVNPTPDTRFYAFDLHADAGRVPDRTSAMKRDPLC